MGRGRRRGPRDRRRGRGPRLLRRLRPVALAEERRATAPRPSRAAGTHALGPDGRLRRHEAPHRGLHGLWRSRKPTIAKVHGHAVAGGSDIALCCDLLVMADDATIGYMPTRVWGCPTTAMWTFRLGPARAKQLMFTGDLIDGAQGRRMGPRQRRRAGRRARRRDRQARARIAGVPRSHLAMHKMVVNQVMLTTGLEQAQTLATVFDGVTRHNPEGCGFAGRRSSKASRRRSSGATAAGRSRKATRRARSSPSSSEGWRRRSAGLERAPLENSSGTLLRVWTEDAW